MKIIKSSRHSKIIGNFGESLICNWLSRSGFEVVVIDHTAIDIIAYNPVTGQRLGITVKSRTREKGKEENPVNIFKYRKEKNDRQKLLDACKTFACEPWIGIYVETSEFADVYLTSLKNYDEEYRGKEERVIDDWKMNMKYKKRYNEDPNIKHIKIRFDATNWNWKK